MTCSLYPDSGLLGFHEFLVAAMQKKENQIRQTRRQTARQATCATAGAVRYRGVPLLRSQPGANCLPGSGRRLSLGRAFCSWPRFGSPGHFICVVCPTVPGAASIYLFLFFESSNQSNRISCVCLVFGPRSHQPGLRRRCPLRKFHGGRF